MAQRRDHGARDQPDALGDRGDRRQQDHGARPRRRRILIAGQGVLAGVEHEPVPGGAGGEHDVLADHHGVEPGVLSLACPPHQAGQVAAVGHGPVLAEDQAHSRRGHPGPPGIPAPAIWHGASAVRRSGTARSISFLIAELMGGLQHPISSAIKKDGRRERPSVPGPPSSAVTVRAVRRAQSAGNPRIVRPGSAAGSRGTPSPRRMRWR